MNKRYKIRVKRPWVGYSGSTIQQNYAEDIDHGYLLWDIEGRDKFDVKFRKLINPQPFVTVDWLDDPNKTVQQVIGKYPVNSRYRVKSQTQLHQHDVITVSRMLRELASASEVTFKTVQRANKDLIIRSQGTTSFVKNDLRNVDVLMTLIREYTDNRSSIDAETWNEVAAHVSRYVSVVNSDVNDVTRNVRWSLRQLRFDNLFAYGSDNIIDFDKLDGIVGIFGPNRSGKSSIVGTIMYSLFNATDRGSIKNLHVINVRKQVGYARAIVNVDSVDYVIERQTAKIERKGQVFAPTTLNVYRYVDGVAHDIAGEQRNDTEKVIRNLIGTPDDFLLTSLAAQDELKTFISYGSTKRRQIISRFLDLDIFDKLYEQVKLDFNVIKGTVKSLSSNDDSDDKLVSALNTAEASLVEHATASANLHNDLIALRSKRSTYSMTDVVTQEQLDEKRNTLTTAAKRAEQLSDQLNAAKRRLESLLENVGKIDSVIDDDELSHLENAKTKFDELKAKLVSAKHQLSTADANLTRSKRSVKLLDDVPCGDSYPMCKFIKDAHSAKASIDKQMSVFDELTEQVNAINADLSAYESDPTDALEKHRKLRELRLKFLADKAKEQSSVDVLTRSLNDAVAARERASIDHKKYADAFSIGENAEIRALDVEIARIQSDVKEHDRKKIIAATEKGRLSSIIERKTLEKRQRDESLKQMRALEIIMSAFSRKGIPLMITKQQLPMINEEISQILQGIVDFTIELEMDDESDTTEIYINYGDSRRLVELCSGMEKMIASVAIRVALINVSSLPKTNMFVIDEGFGALDEMGVEACNRLLMSLKKYFKIVIVITHVEGVKDAADIIIELSKNEKDAVCVYA